MKAYADTEGILLAAVECDSSDDDEAFCGYLQGGAANSGYAVPTMLYGPGGNPSALQEFSPSSVGKDFTTLTAQDIIDFVTKEFGPPASPASPSSTAVPQCAPHYGQPPCATSDESEMDVKGATVCAATCAAASDCPTVPDGVKATPECSGGQCALKCGKDSGCPSGATCVKSGLFSGTCAFASGDGPAFWA